MFAFPPLPGLPLSVTPLPLPVLETGRKDRPRHGLVLRHFAGHARHAEQLDRPLRVAHLTDLHVGLITPHAAQRAAVGLANASGADLVALTGDFVGFGHRYLDRLTAIVAGFEAPVVAVLGNHDHWAGAAIVREALERAGALVLQNAWTEVQVAGTRLQVVGVDDAFTGHADAASSVTGLDARRPTLGLSHVCEEAESLWAAGVPLVLSGHTHAGHVTWGGLNEHVLSGVLGHRFVHGLYGCRLSPTPGGALYVSAGVGCEHAEGIVDLRINCPPEMTLIELVPR